MLFWVISVLLLNSSELHPSALLTLNIYYQPGRSAASLQSSLPSFPKTTHVHIASSIAVDLSAKLTQNNSLPAALLTNRLLSHSSCYNEEFMCCSEWLECLSWSYTEFFSSARLNVYIYHYLSHQQHYWRVTSQLFQCFRDLNLNQKRLEQDPGLAGPVGGLRTVFIKFEIMNF